MDAEVAVIGVGTMGSMAMWQLSQKGVSVIGFEQYGIANEYSAVGGESRIFRTAYMEGLEYIPLNQASQKLWRKLEEEANENLLTLTGGLTIGHPEATGVKEVIESIEKYDLEHKILSYEEGRQAYPQHKIYDDEVIVYDENAGYIRPELSVLSAVRLAKQAGNKIYSYTKVESIKQTNDGIKIIANGKEYHVKKVVITCSSSAARLVPQFKDYITARGITLTWFNAKNMEQFKADKFPVFARVRDGLRLTGIPALEGTMVKVSSNMSPSLVEDPENLDKKVTHDHLKKLKNDVEAFLPDLFSDPIRSAIYMESFTTDGHPIVDKVNDHTVVLTGFSGHGFKMSPLMGQIAADLIVDGQTAHNIDFLSAKRFD